MHFLSVSQMRAADRAVMAAAPGAGMALMFRAGRAVARAAKRLADLRGRRRVVCIAGRGNNGGDACAAARMLAEAGFSVRALLTAAESDLRGDALSTFRWMRAGGVPHDVLADPAAWRSPECIAAVPADGVVVDGVLGTGCAFAPRGAALEAIRWINAARSEGNAVVAIDLPSGMNGDTGEVPGECAAADWTVTLARPKTCFLAPAAARWAGHLSVADIGLPAAAADAQTAAAPCRLIAGPAVKAAFPPRPLDAHKGMFGRVLVLGGSAAYPHAPVLAALGALRGGAGLLTLAVPAASRVAAACHVPEAMIRELPAGPDGGPAAAAAEGWDFNAFDVIVMGPGLTRSASAGALFDRVARTYAGRLVVDADALALLAARGGAGAPASRQWILTPHPGEAALLAGRPVAEIQADRPGWARRLADAYAATVVLKGAGTCVCAPGGIPRINLTGNPGMAAGGMGDVLAGLIGALWAAPGAAALAAAECAVLAHGTAGDFAAWQTGQTSLSARDLVRFLPLALSSGF